MISVVILNYNRKEDLKQTLTRLYWQQNAVFEVIVVDQNSLDGSVEMVQTLFPSVRLFALQENIGVAGGRNFGAMHANGEYLVFLDDDAEFVGFDELRKVELVFGCNSNIHLIAFNINGHPEVPEKFKLFSVHPDKFVNGYIGCGHAIRKSSFEKLGGYTKELFFWGEEIEFAIKVFTIPSGKILYKGDVVVFHRVSSQSRLKWKEGRFYYKVRNRLFLMRQSFPFLISVGFQFYYFLAYGVRAIQLSEYRSFFKGVRDSFSFNINSSQKLNWYQSFKWFFDK